MVTYVAQKGSSSLQAYERQLAALQTSIKNEQTKLDEAEIQLAQVKKEREEAEAVKLEVKMIK